MIDKVIPGIRAVTVADIQRVAQTYLSENNRTVGVLIPEGAPIREKPEGELGDRNIH
jgi:zinc protease